MNKGVFLAIIIVIALSLSFYLFKGGENNTQISLPTANSQVTELGTEQKNMTQPEMTIDTKKSYQALMHTNMGDITLDLYADKTPITVNNFVSLAKSNFYDGVIFHRVIEGFMIQGGDPTGTGRGGPGYQFEDETVSDLKFTKKGLLAMANSGPSTNGSQFFITLAPTDWLNGHHTIFGEVTSGMDIVDKIGTTQTDSYDRPVNKVAIESIEIIEK